MKIPNDYPNFIDEKSLIVVSGRESAIFYSANKGFIKKIVEFGEKAPKYSDREGFFMRMGKGRLFGSGSVYESKIKTVEEKYRKDFNKEISQELRNNNYESIYVFVPNFMSGYIEEEIPNNYRDRIKETFYGNYTKKHPLELLSKIGQRFAENHPGPVPVRNEARKILNRFEKSK